MTVVVVKDRYTLDKRIGQGTQSVVYRGRDLVDNRTVAVKQIICEQTARLCWPLTSLGANFREVSSLVLLMNKRSQHIVRLLDVVSSSDRLSLVFEHCDENLSRFIRRSKTDGIYGGLRPSVVRDFSHQLISGMAVVHGEWIIHRDIKPENIFVRKGVLKIGDFGLSKQYSYPAPPETLEVASLWYRAPEVLLRTGYDVGMDLWSIGCVIGEMVRGKPMFTADTECGLLQQIVCEMFDPSVESWKLLEGVLGCGQKDDRMSRLKRQICSNVGYEGLDLILGFLEYDSNKRLRCDEALRHDYFENSENLV